MRSYDDITQNQQLAIDRLYAYNQTLLIAPKGFGKAVCGQTAAQELIRDGVLKRVLVVAPLKVCTLTWGTEWQHWAHLERPGMAIGDELERRSVIEESGHSIVVINIENLAWFFERYENWTGLFDGYLIDESTKFKAAGSQAVKAIRYKTKQVKWRVAMTADAVVEMGTDIYTQALVLDGGKALGRNQEMFRRKYFYPTDFQQRKWAILPGMDKALVDKLGSLLYVARGSDYEASLPELIDDVVRVEMPHQVRTYYDELEREGYTALPAADIETPSAGVLSGKLQQFTAGAVYDADKRTHWLHTEKFDALERLVASADGPVAVAYSFIFELEELCRRYPDIAVLADDPVGVERAWNNGEVAVMALHPKSASHGLNLQYGGHELIVLTVPWGADPWEQLVGRFRRRGQTSPFVRRTTIICDDSIDELVLDRHDQKNYASVSLNDIMRRSQHDTE